MFTALLLGLAVDDLTAASFLIFVIAGAAAPLCASTSMLASRAAFDDMLVKKGLLTGKQLRLIRHGTKSRGIVTGVRPTGASREDHREVVIDVMVRKPGGGQFPAHETALIPVTSLAKVSPGSIIDAYYRSGDESAVAVCVPPG